MFIDEILIYVSTQSVKESATLWDFMRRPIGYLLRLYVPRMVHSSLPVFHCNRGPSPSD